MHMTLSDFIALCSLFIGFGELVVAILGLIMTAIALAVAICQSTNRK